MDRGYFNLVTLLIFFISILITSFISVNTAYKVDIVENKLRDKKTVNAAYCEAHALLRNDEFLNNFYSDFSQWNRSDLEKLIYKKKFKFKSVLKDEEIDCLVQHKNDDGYEKERINIRFNLEYLGQRKYVSMDCRLPKKILLKGESIISKSNLKNPKEKTILEELLRSLDYGDSYLIEIDEGVYEGIYIVDNNFLDKDFYLNGILIIKGRDISMDKTKKINISGLVITEEDLKEEIENIKIQYNFKNVIQSSYKSSKLLELEIENIKIYGGIIIV